MSGKENNSQSPSEISNWKGTFTVPVTILLVQRVAARGYVKM